MRSMAKSWVLRCVLQQVKKKSDLRRKVKVGSMANDGMA